MTKLSRQDLLLAKGIDKPVASNYDITKDEIFNKFSNSVIPIDIDTPISGIAPHTGSFGKVEAKHLLSRCLNLVVETSFQTQNRLLENWNGPEH